MIKSDFPGVNLLGRDTETELPGSPWAWTLGKKGLLKVRKGIKEPQGRKEVIAASMRMHFLLPHVHRTVLGSPSTPNVTGFSFS